MKDTPASLKKAIAANQIRATQAQAEENSHVEFRHRIWAIKDIATLLLLRQQDHSAIQIPEAQWYSDVALASMNRVSRLIDETTHE